MLRTFALVVLLCVGLGSCAGTPYAVSVAVADLRSAPIPLNLTFVADPNQQSQVLYAEAVLVLGALIGWLSLIRQEAKMRTIIR